MNVVIEKIMVGISFKAFYDLLTSPYITQSNKIIHLVKRNMELIRLIMLWKTLKLHITSVKT